MENKEESIQKLQSNSSLVEEQDQQKSSSNNNIESQTDKLNSELQMEIEQEDQEDDISNNDNDNEKDEDFDAVDESVSEKQILSQKREDQKKFLEELQNDSEKEDNINEQKEVSTLDMVEEKMKKLLLQAQKYTDYLIHRVQKRKQSISMKEKKKRGNWEDEQEEERELLEDEEGHTQQSTYLQKQPSILKGGQLKSYQMLSLNWMISLYEAGINGILADQMGLGKTIQSISLVAFMREVKKIKGPHLVFGPKSVLGNWQKEFAKWLPNVNVVKLIATKEERTEILDKYINKGNFDVCLTSYEGVKICANALRKINWKYVIIDEAHKIKNEESQLSKIIRSFNTQNKLLLTGTPLQNNLHELWSLLNFILPDLFRESDIFDEWFTANQSNQGGEEVDQKNKEMISQLHKILAPFMLRRTKAEVEKTMPPKKEIHLFIGLTDLQIDIYKKLLKKQNLTGDGDAQKKHYLNTLMQLRKCCNHPYLFEGVEEEGLPVLGEHLVNNCGKLRVLDKLLKKLYGGHQVLIFSQMTMLLDILEDYCNFRGYEYCRIDGSTDMEVRDKGINDFTAPGSKKFIYLLSTRAGGLGLNLMTADTVILYDSDWNPQMDLQAMDRAHRIGQKNQVNVYRFISENTVEEKIVERQSIKLRWDNLVISQGKMVQKQKSLGKDELKDIVQHGAANIFKSGQGTYNEEDIDKLLQRGEDKTKQFNKNISDKLGDVTNDDEKMNLGMQQINIYDFVGLDEDKGKEDAEIMDEILAREYELQMMDNRSRRDKKSLNYNINQQFMLQMQTQNTTSLKAPVAKQVKIPEHQLYKNRERLQELLQIEEDYRIQNLVKQKKESIRKEQEKRRLNSTRYNSVQSYQQQIKAGGSAKDIDQQQQQEKENNKNNNEGKSEDNTNQEDNEENEQKPTWWLELTEEENKEKEELMESGFPTWLKSDFTSYIQGCERYGRTNIQAIHNHIKTKQIEEVVEYGKAFWDRINELSEKDRIIKNIEKGENLLNQKKGYIQLVQEKCDKYRNVKEEIQFDSDQLYNKCKSKFYTLENDKFLVYLCYKFNYGNWKEIRKAIKFEPLFKFDSYFRSRSEQDLSKRMSSLIKMLEKEREFNKAKEESLKSEIKERKKKEKEAKQFLKHIQQTHNQQKIMQEPNIVIDLEDSNDNNNKEDKQNQQKSDKQQQKSTNNLDQQQQSNPKDSSSGSKKENEKMKQTNITNFFQNSANKKRKASGDLQQEETESTQQKKEKTNQ